MAEHGAALAEARERTIVALSDRLARQSEGAFPQAEVALDHWRAAPEAELRDQLHKGRSRDAGAGRTLIGPHRTDLAVTHVGKGQPAGLCSTGEQKALLLGLVLAHADLVAAQTGRPPILLLDEVAAHLDSRRRAALFERLRASGGQVWMTGTEAALFEAIGPDASWLQTGAGFAPTA